MMNKYTIVLLLVHTLFIFTTVNGAICAQLSPFPDWMQGRFIAQFADGSLANETFGVSYANITLSNGTTGILTITQPVNKTTSFFIRHECVQIKGTEPQQRCLIILPNCNGYTAYVHEAPELVSVCPESTSSPGVEKIIVERSSH